MSGLFKTLHLFWGRSRPLSWLRMQTVETFARHNPDWQIIVWYRHDEPAPPAWTSHEQKKPYTGTDYFNALRDIADVREVETSHAVPDVIFSDWLRWHLLATHGGWWSDFDILYTGPMPPAGDGPQLARYDDGTWPVGFLGAPDDEARNFFAIIEDAARQRLNAKGGYQDIGCALLGRHAKRLAPCFPWVYPVTKPSVARRAYFESADYQMPDKYIGCHWYAGTDFSSRFEMGIEEGTADAEAFVLRVLR